MLEVHSMISDRVSDLVKIGFDSEAVHDERYIKTRIKFYDVKVNISLHDNGMFKKVSQCVCFSVISIGYVFNLGKNYYPQLFLEQCKQIAKKDKKSLSLLMMNQKSV